MSTMPNQMPVLETAKVTHIDLRHLSLHPRSLGRGGQGCVQLGLFKNKFVAAKVSESICAKEEHMILSTLQHPNVVKTFGYAAPSQVDPIASEALGRRGVNCKAHPVHIALYQYYPDGSLRVQVHNQKLSKLEREIMAYQVAADMASALVYIHSRRLVHQDLKPANILMRGKQAILGDFGSCCNVGIPSRGSGTAYYRSPESSRVSVMRAEALKEIMALRPVPCDQTPIAPVFKKHLTSFKSDIWSLGVTLIEVLLGRHVTRGLIFDDSVKDPKAWIEKIASPEFWKKATPKDIIKTFSIRKDIKAKLKVLSEEMRECGVDSVVPLVFKLLAVDPKARPTALGFHHMLSHIRSPSFCHMLTHEDSSLSLSLGLED